jgi:hypothetical protein
MNSITIKIDKRPMTLMRRDVGNLVRIARAIDRNDTLMGYHGLAKLAQRDQEKTKKRMAKWLDTHGPDSEVQS